ncbi:hypothetical protein [Baekduia sp. Peel2402]|uniref:hypothetical protein n=1 Tax=Baekduia sp. Peel2402 TaxID=3458296 RepID=UPI00403E7ECD
MTVGHADHEVSRLIEEARGWFHEAPSEAMAAAVKAERAAREAGASAAEGWDVWELPEVVASAARKLDVRITQDARRALAWAAIYE